MTLPSSGPLSMSMIEAEMGGSPPTSLTEYYGDAAGLPQSGTISIEDFYGQTYGPEGETFTIHASKNSVNTGTNSSTLHRYGYGRTGKTSFVHPESGSSTSGFGTIDTYTDVAGGNDLFGIQVCDYAVDGMYYVFDQETQSMRRTGQGSSKHITVTIDNLSHTTTTDWQKIHFKFSGSTWYTLLRSDYAYYRDHYQSTGEKFITWTPTNSQGNDVQNFDTIFNNIKSKGNAAASADDFQVYFSLL